MPHFTVRLLLAVLSTLTIMTRAAETTQPATGPSTMPGTYITAVPIRGLIERGGESWQPVQVKVHRTGAQTTAQLAIDGVRPSRVTIPSGESSFEMLAPAVKQSQQAIVSVAFDDQTLRVPLTLQPVRKLTIYILPHSHNDIGYTALQSEVETKQVENLRKGMALAKKTADYPPGARFVWNLEGLWSADLFMQRATEPEQAVFFQAIRDKQVGLNGMYANELTGLCRPEELLQIFRFGTRLSERAGMQIDSAMLSDVPGMTWGTATAMRQAGIRYFSLAPNWFDRIGTIMQQWQDKPFWWVSPSGKDRILVWVPWTGYAMSHVEKKLTDQWVGKYQARLDTVNFPYEISYIRWSGHGDNAEPDGAICDFVKDWNAKYAWPKFVISTTSEAFQAFEQQYGDRLPEYRGDLTPYWEDGAASSALETAINRNASERLTQAETMYLLRGKSDAFLADQFAEAWKNVILYSEHTWGAWCSVSDSENPLTSKQWAAKRQFALNAEQMSYDLLNASATTQPTPTNAVDVFNTTSWSRTEVLFLSPALSKAGDHVTDARGTAVPSQRLSSGELAVLVRDLPPLAGTRLLISAGGAGSINTAVKIDGQSLDNGLIRVAFNAATGDIADFGRKSDSTNLAKTAGLNKYVYLAGNHLTDVQSSGDATITVLDSGPLVARLRVESAAPGCNKLTREYSLEAGADHLAMANTVEKKRVALNPHPEDRKASNAFAQHESKESVSFAFDFNVPAGQVRLDEPLAMVRPETDPIPGACKDWLPVGRYVDVSNDTAGVTLATLDAPLVELGQLSTLLGSQSKPDVWRHHLDPTQLIYSWVMNNHWGTNYRAYQEGPVTFRYALRPHDGFDSTAATRFATALSQPLVVSPAEGDAPSGSSLLHVSPASIVVTALKPSDDKTAWIARLMNVGPDDATAAVKVNADAKIYASDLAERRGDALDADRISVPKLGLVTLRIELAARMKN